MYFIAFVGVVIIFIFFITIFQNNFLIIFNFGNPDILKIVLNLNSNKKFKNKGNEVSK